MEGWAERETIEESSIALIREYLNRKGCKKSLKALDEEHPRSERSICNRAELAQALHVAPIMRKNKSLSKPFKTIVEILVWDLLKKHRKLTHESHNRSPKLSRPSTARADFYSRDQESKLELDEVDFHSKEELNKPQTLHEMSTTTISTEEVVDAQPLLISPSKIRPQSSRTYRNLNAPVMVAGLRTMNSMKHRNKKQANSVKEMLSASPEKVISPRDNIPSGLTAKSDEKVGQNPTHDVENSGESLKKLDLTTNSEINGKISPKNFRKPNGMELNKQVLKKEENTLQDVEDFESDVDLLDKKCVEWLERGNDRKFNFDPNDPEVKIDTEMKSTRKSSLSSPISRRKKQTRSVVFDLQQSSKPLEYETAKALRQLIFGSSSVRGFTDEWIEQSFTFNGVGKPKNLRFGIKQNKGGPCGLLAAVQAFVLKHLLFGKAGNQDKEVRQANVDNLSVSNRVRTKCLAEAIIEIIWRAGGKKRGVVTTLGIKPGFSAGGGYRADGITEFIRTTECNTLESLHDAIYNNIESFERGRGAAILLLYSAILSRGVKQVQTDMDEAGGTMMGAHSYCTQEMVNLLTTGVASSNVFNDQVELDGATILKGVSARCDVGLLSLFEHYQSCQVGSFLKTPRYPVWIICSESHFTVLFCLNRDLVSDWSVERLFHLYYYDGLANQDEEIQLTVNTMASAPEVKHPNGLIPPLELCIKTKWPEAKIDWNGTDPIL